MRLTRGDQESLLRKLDAMPDFLERAFTRLSPSEDETRGPNDTFSPVEQCWHLADLEREGYGVRIRRLLAEDDPLLPDFDGARVAEERNYRSLLLADGINAFRTARIANVKVLRSLLATDWTRTGTQEGVGRISLRDVPPMMAEHDGGHCKEIEAWAAARNNKSGPG